MIEPNSVKTILGYYDNCDKFLKYLARQIRTSMNIGFNCK